MNISLSNATRFRIKLGYPIAMIYKFLRLTSHIYYYIYTLRLCYIHMELCVYITFLFRAILRYLSSCLLIQKNIRRVFITLYTFNIRYT